MAVLYHPIHAGQPGDQKEYFQLRCVASHQSRAAGWAFSEPLQLICS